jgi:hypothetical protein
MKLNVEEQNFVFHWSHNYVEAIESARAFYKNAHAEYNPKKEITEVTEDIERYANLYANYRYWYGVMFGMILGMSFEIRIDIYGACHKALNHLHDEAYGYDGYEKEII